MSALPVGYAQGLDGPVEISRWCQNCKELVLAHERTGCCLWCGSETAAATAAAREGRPTLAAIATATCKIDDCNEEPEAKLGPYGGLCASHAAEARALRKTAAGGGAKMTSSPGGLTTQTRQLIPLARAVEKARGRAGALPSSEHAEAELAEAIRRVQGSATAENLARLERATKEMKALQPSREKAQNAQLEAEETFRLALGKVIETLRG